MRENGILPAAPVGLHHLSYYLAPNAVSIDYLAKSGILSPEDVTLYRDSRGLNIVHISEEETALEMAMKAASRALAEGGIDPREIDILIFYHSLYNAVSRPLNPVNKIRYEL